MRSQLERRIPPHILRLVLLMAVLAALPHVMNLPLAVSALFVLVLSLRLVALQIPRLETGRWLLFFLTVSGVLLVFNQHHTLFGRDAGVSLLCLMLGLKLLELHKRRDVYVVAFISYFVVITQFLFNQGFWLMLYLLFVVVGLTALLLEMNRIDPSKRLLDPLSKTFSIALQSLPIALMLFFLFPRLTQPLWQFDSGEEAVTGLSDRISFGSISRLILSSEVAFRVRFADRVPDPEQRYWRALVIWDTDGLDWFNRSSPYPESAPRLLEAAAPIAYEVLLEPHHQSWLYALDLPGFAPAGSDLTTDFTILNKHPVHRTKQYRLVSNTRYRTAGASQGQIGRALALPDNVTLRMRELVQGWRRQVDSDSALIRLALQHFNGRSFVYTLNPPVYPDNPIDRFLFEGRAGFCEHYASSFTLMMRLAGIPSRLVVGYQGGEYNPLGGYYVLRQSDAHAWSEVWLEPQGWVRIDPTAAVAPERIEHPIQTGLAEVGAPVLFRLDEGGMLESALGQIRHALDAANIGWRRWILGYNRVRQFDLLQNLGFDPTHASLWLLAGMVAVGLVLVLILLRLMLQGRRKSDAIVASYETLCSKLARAGFPRRSSEGPLDYSRRIARQRPELTAQSKPLLEDYIDLRYGGRPSPGRIRSFARDVRRFRPKKVNQ